MKRFRCPRCGYEMQTIGSEVWHQCRHKKIKLEEVEDED